MSGMFHVPSYLSGTSGKSAPDLSALSRGAPLEARRQQVLSVKTKCRQQDLATGTSRNYRQQPAKPGESHFNHRQQALSAVAKTGTPPDATSPRSLTWSDVTDSLSELLWPTRCVVCELPGELLCADCRAHLPWIEQRLACPVCGAPFGQLVCTECQHDWPGRSCVCALPFEGAGARLATCLKDAYELRLAPVIAAAIATALDEASAWPAPDGAPRFDAEHTDALCFVPATYAAYQRRGFDHMELVARELSWLLELPLDDVLVRLPARDQRELGRDERARNLAGTVAVAGSVEGLDLLLVDDVVTTGSTLNACVQELLDHGAASVSTCALARVW